MRVVLLTFFLIYSGLAEAGWNNPFRPKEMLDYGEGRKIAPHQEQYYPVPLTLAQTANLKLTELQRKLLREGKLTAIGNIYHPVKSRGNTVENGEKGSIVRNQTFVALVPTAQIKSVQLIMENLSFHPIIDWTNPQHANLRFEFNETAKIELLHPNGETLSKSFRTKGILFSIGPARPAKLEWLSDGKALVTDAYARVTRLWTDEGYQNLLKPEINPDVYDLTLENWQKGKFFLDYVKWAFKAKYEKLYRGISYRNTLNGEIGAKNCCNGLMSIVDLFLPRLSAKTACAVASEYVSSLSSPWTPAFFKSRGLIPRGAKAKKYRSLI